MNDRQVDPHQTTTAELIARIEELEARLGTRRRGLRPALGRKATIVTAGALALTIAIVPSLTFAAGGANPVVWALTGNAGTSPSTNYIGTSDANGLSVRTNGTQAIGIDSNQNVTFSKTIHGDISGNAGSVTNGLYSTGSYADPSWLTSLAGSKISGDISGNAGSVTNGLYSTGSYADPSWLTSLAGSKISGDISGNAGSVTNGLYSTGSYSNPSWLTSLAGGKITGSVANATHATTADSAGSFTGSLAGDVTGTQGGTKVVALEGTHVSDTFPSNGQVLRYDGYSGSWQPASLPAAPSTYIESHDATVQAVTDHTSNVSCSSGYTAIDGGYQLDSDALSVYASYPEESVSNSTVDLGGSNQSWHFEVNNPDLSSHGASFYVTCLKTS